MIGFGIRQQYQMCLTMNIDIPSIVNHICRKGTDTQTYALILATICWDNSGLIDISNFTRLGLDCKNAHVPSFYQMMSRGFNLTSRGFNLLSGQPRRTSIL